MRWLEKRWNAKNINGAFDLRWSSGEGSIVLRGEKSKKLHLKLLEAHSFDRELRYWGERSTVLDCMLHPVNLCLAKKEQGSQLVPRAIGFQRDQDCRLWQRKLLWRAMFGCLWILFLFGKKILYISLSICCRCTVFYEMVINSVNINMVLPTLQGNRNRPRLA